MSTLYQRRLLACPYHRARLYLESSLKGLAESGQPQVVQLTVPVASSTGAALEKDVVITYGVATDPMKFDEPWKMHWGPKDGGPYPEFDGTLTIRADEEYTSCWLELRGSYEPPLGAVGAAFDAVLGSRIASSTARGFLQKIGSAMESTYQREEGAKHVR
ncbi:MAG: hypothetical protein ABI282_06460 [Candidatus Baltobacteraceae bacterium]